MSEQTGVIDAKNMSAEEVVDVLEKGPQSTSKRKISGKEKLRNLFKRKDSQRTDSSLDKTVGYLQGKQSAPSSEHRYQGEPLNTPSQTKAA